MRDAPVLPQRKPCFQEPQGRADLDLLASSVADRLVFSDVPSIFQRANDPRYGRGVQVDVVGESAEREGLVRMEQQPARYAAGALGERIARRVVVSHRPPCPDRLRRLRLGMVDQNPGRADEHAPIASDIRDAGGAERISCIL